MALPQPNTVCLYTLINKTCNIPIVWEMALLIMHLCDFTRFHNLFKRVCTVTVDLIHMGIISDDWWVAMEAYNWRWIVYNSPKKKKLCEEVFNWMNLHLRHSTTSCCRLREICRCPFLIIFISIGLLNARISSLTHQTNTE